VRFVLDTHVPVSGLIADGPPRRLVDGAIGGEFELCMSDVLLAELLDDVLSRSTFAARLEQAGLTLHGIVDDLRRIALMVAPVDTPRVVPTDPDDDPVIVAAVVGQADLIASADKRDLLPLGSHAGMPIVNAREAVERLEAWRRG
jgi:putative PIN family toxin of toxin-antitoxin system